MAPSMCSQGWAAAISERGKLYKMLMRLRFIMYERSDGGAPPDTGPLFSAGSEGALFSQSSQRKEAKKIYLPESKQLPLGRPLSVPHRTLNAPQRNALQCYEGSDFEGSKIYSWLTAS